MATDILHLHSGVIDNYRGNYESFYKTREERLKNQQKEYEAQKEYRDHIQVSGELWHSLVPYDQKYVAIFRPYNPKHVAIFSAL